MHGSRNFRQDDEGAVFDEEVCMGFHERYNDIEIKQDFLYTNICWVPRVSLKPVHEH